MIIHQKHLLVHRQPRVFLPFIMTALVLNMTSCVLFKVVLLQVQQQQGKPKFRGRKRLSFTLIFYQVHESSAFNMAGPQMRFHPLI